MYLRISEGRKPFLTKTAAIAAALAILWLAPATGQAAGGHGGGPSDRMFYERIEGLTVNVLARAQLHGQLVVNLRLESDPQGAQKVKKYEPKLRDAYNQRLLRLGQTLLDVRRPLDLERMESTLQDATNTILGPDVATVLLTSAMVRQ